MSLTNTFVNGAVIEAGEHNVNFSETKWEPGLVYSHSGLGLSAGSKDTLIHSATTWTRLDDTSTMRTTDTGANWVAATTDLGNMSYGKVSDADGTKAIAFKDSNLNVAISSDSGDTWAQATTDPADQPYVISFPTATVAVMGTAKSVGARGIYFSTDAGANWTICTTGPVVAVLAISMFNSTTGFAVADGGAIWKTTDGGDNWTDTTHTTDDPLSGSNITMDILAISTTEFVGISAQTPKTIYYDGSGNASNPFGWSYDNNTYFPCPPVKLTNGEFVFGLFLQDTSGMKWAELWKMAAKDSTSGKIQRMIFPAKSIPAKTITSLANSFLAEYDTNKLIFVSPSGYVLIDESNT